MKIIFFGSDYIPTNGGIATYTKEWLHALSLENISGNVRIFGNKNPRKEKINNNLSLETVRSVNFFYVGFTIFIDFIKNINADYFYALNLFPIGFWTVFWSKVFFKKSIITFYGADACDTRTSRKVVRLQSFAIKNATIAITISEFTKNKIIKRYNLSYKNNIQVIYPILPKLDMVNKIDNIKVEQEKNKLGINDNNFVIVTVCRLVKRKGVPYLIEAISLIKDQNVKLIVVGDGPERKELENIRDKFNLKDRVYFVGKVPDLSIYYSIAKVGSLVSYIIEEEGDFEGLGLVLLEAESYSLPVIGTRSGGIPEAIDNDKTGFVVEERNAHSIADSILKLKNDNILYNQMKNRTKDFLEERFGRENTSKRLFGILSKEMKTGDNK